MNHFFYVFQKEMKKNGREKHETKRNVAYENENRVISQNRSVCVHVKHTKTLIYEHLL